MKDKDSSDKKMFVINSQQRRMKKENKHATGTSSNVLFCSSSRCKAQNERKKLLLNLNNFAHLLYI